MTAKTKDQIKAFFETGDKPTQAQFADLIDSYIDKSGPVGTLETAASGAAVGIAVFSGATPNVGSINAYDVVRNAMGITVYTTALVTSLLAGTSLTTAAASAVAADVIAASYATTAQANAGTSNTGIMNPVLTKNAIQSLGSGAMVLISTKTASNSATIDFVNGTGGVVLDGTYKAYAVVISRLVPASDNVALWMRTSTNAGSSFDNGASNYYGRRTNKTMSTAYDATQANNLTEMPLTAAELKSTGYASVKAFFDDPSVSSNNFGITAFTSYVGSTVDTAAIGWDATYARAANADVDAIRFLMSSGNITSGTFKLYGIL